MRQRRGVMLIVSGLLSIAAWSAPAAATAKQDGSVHPITSLPKPQGQTEPVAPIEPVVQTEPAPMMSPAVVTPTVDATPTTTYAPEPAVTQSQETTPVPVPHQAPADAAPPTSPATGTNAYPLPPGRENAPMLPDGQTPSSSNMELPPSGPLPEEPRRRKVKEEKIKQEKESYTVGPFSTVALGVKIGFAGLGFDIATPLAQRFNLRTGFSFFQFSGTFNEDGTNISGEAKFRSGTISLDIFPFNNGFRISPGVTYYNGNNMNMAANVPAGGAFQLGASPTLYSSITDPIHGTASMTFGNRVAPSLTIGVGNMIPRSGRHISFPFEIGFQYLGKQPMVNLYLGGTACLQNPNAVGFNPLSCGSVATYFGSDLQEENDEVNSDIRGLRFYPIISQGFAVRF